MYDPRLIEIGKLDAAEQQLKTATRLWFYDIEPISAHSLAFAAYEVIHAVSKALNPNRPELLLDSSLINPVFRVAVNRRFKKAANFFKHADNDPHDKIDFMQGLTWCFIYYSIYGLQLSGRELIDEFVLFQNWVAFNFPDKLTEESRRHYLDGLTVEHLARVRAMSRKEFFDEGLAFLRAGG